MKNLTERLIELKNELEPELQSRMIFLLNLKDTKMFEAIVAWKTLPQIETNTIFVEDNATMEDLWNAVEINVFNYAEALGCNVQSALPRLKQLQKLNIIYPDGSVASLAMQIINTYIINQVGKIQPKEQKTKKVQ
jgi:hypothetical protein